MQNEKKDRRVQRTLRMLDEALMDLLEEKPMSEIGVTELCAAADINRNTFYSHYSNPNDVLAHLEQQLLSQIGDALSASSSSEKATETVLRTLHDNKRLAKVLLSDNASSAVVYTLFDSARTRAMSKANRHSNKLSPAYQILMSEFSLAGGIAVIRSWAADGMQLPPNDVAKFIRIVSNTGSDGIQESPDPEFHS